MNLSVSHIQLQTPTHIGILSHLAVPSPFYKGEYLIWSSLCRIYSGSIVFSFPSCSLPKHSGLCVLAHSCLHASFHYWAFSLFFFSFSLVPQNDLHKDYKWYFYMCPKISLRINTCLSLTIRSLKAEFFTTLSFPGPLSAAASNLGVEVPLDCSFRFPQKEIIYDFSTQAKSQNSTASTGTLGLTIPPDYWWRVKVTCFI